MAENGDILSCPDGIIENARISLRRWWIPINEMAYYSLEFFTQPYSNRKRKSIKLFLQLVSHPSAHLEYCKHDGDAC